MEPRFICDVHLGKLAKALRMLGFNTCYQNNFTNQDLERVAIEQSRVLLSRNPAFSKNKKLKFYLITSEETFVQIKTVFDYFALKNKIQPFTLCFVCNQPLQKVHKEKIADQLLANTATYYNEFWQCGNCRRIYWKGSHYQRMLKEINDITN